MMGFCRLPDRDTNCICCMMRREVHVNSVVRTSRLFVTPEGTKFAKKRWSSQLVRKFWIAALETFIKEAKLIEGLLADLSDVSYKQM